MLRPLAALTLLLACEIAQAQQPPVDTTQPPVDTILFIPPDRESQSRVVEDSTNYEGRLIQSPTAGLFKSLAVPGWGQLGNKRTTKAALFFGLQTIWIGAAVHFDRQASDFRRQWESSADLAERNSLYSLYDNRRGRRNGYIWFAAITAFLAGFDAYVDAHLSGAPFHRSQATISLEPELSPERLGAGLTIRF